MLGRVPASTALGALEACLGVCLVLWGSGVLHARAAVRSRGAGRRASALHARAAVRSQGAGRRASAPGAPAAPAAAAEGAASPEAAEAPGPGFDVSLQPGACAPLGEPGVSYWDPAGLAAGIEGARFRDYRKAELKHGRVAMLALVGLIAQHGWRFDLAYPYYSPTYDFSSVPSGFGAAVVGTPTSPFIGLFVLAAGLVELRASDDGREPGDFGDPLSLWEVWASGYSPQTAPDGDRRMFKDAELNHGRLAMVGLLGTLLAEYATGFDAVEQWARSGTAYRRTLDLLYYPLADARPLSDYL